MRPGWRCEHELSAHGGAGNRQTGWHAAHGGGAGTGHREARRKGCTRGPGQKDWPARWEAKTKQARQARKVKRGGGSTTHQILQLTSAQGREATHQQGGACGHRAHGPGGAAVQLQLRHQGEQRVRWSEGDGDRKDQRKGDRC